MHRAPIPGASNIPVSVVKLSVSCRNVLDKDFLSKSDPMVVLFGQEFGTNQWSELGRTEVIHNNLNPDFAKRFVLNYFFEEKQNLKFEVYDIDSDSPDLRKHDFLGKFCCTLAEIVTARKLTRDLTRDKKKCRGTITIVAEEQTGSSEDVTLQFQGRSLDKKDTCGKSDPFLSIYRMEPDGTYSVVFRTEVVKNTLNPDWKQFSMSVRTLCHNDYNVPLRFKCYDWNTFGTDQLIGEFDTNLSQLAESLGSSFDLINPEKKRKRRFCSRYRNSGFILVTKLEITPSAESFVDYIQAGTQLNCTIAIDFTASNGDPRDPRSLHFIGGPEPNQYVQALTAVGEIIQDYDSDQFFPVLGFGAKLPPFGQVSDEFFVNGSETNPHCFGISGVLEAYNKCINSVQLFGPTNFAPIIRHVAEIASKTRDGSEYFILLIITDGCITDMANTKEAIVNVATLPLSIIIVGVGIANFDAMHELDGDDIRLTFNGRPAERDIVQFVPFRQFVTPGEGTMMSQARLAKAVLEEIPDQFLSYMRANRIFPGSWNKSAKSLSEESKSKSRSKTKSFR